MALLLKRNSNPDPWYHVHERIINEGDIVCLHSIVGEYGRSEDYPPEIYITRRVDNDISAYRASLNCYDYIGSSKDKDHG